MKRGIETTDEPSKRPTSSSSSLSSSSSSVAANPSVVRVAGTRIPVPSGSSRRVSVVDLTGTSSPGPRVSVAVPFEAAAAASFGGDLDDNDDDVVDDAFEDTAFEDDRGFGEFDYAEEIEDDDNDDEDEEDETGASQSQSHSEADDSLVFLGATSRNPAVSRRRTVFLDDDDDDNEVQVTGVTRRNQGHDQNDEEDPDEALARRLQEEEYAALQSNNMQQNIQQLFGILHPDESEDEDAPIPPNLQLDDYRTRQRLRELERQEALEMAQQAAMAAAAARRGGIRATRATSRVQTPSRGVATRRGRRTRGQLFEDDDEDEEDGVAAGGFPFHDGLPPGLAGMLYGGAFGLQGHRLMGRGGGSAGNALHGLIPELYGAGVAYNPGNYVDDDNFDTSYENLIQLGERIGSAKPKGVRKPVLDSLPTKKFKAQNGSSGSGSSSSSSSTTTANNSSEDDAKCAICLMEFEDGEEVSGVPCLHWFHEPCIKKWLQDSSVCPICRSDVK